MNLSHKIFCSIVAFTLFFSSCGGEQYMQGKRLYKAHCADCHGDAGDGLGKLIPPLAGADYLRDNQQLLPCLLINGMKGEVTVNGSTYNQDMPGQKYSSVQITNIINYINHAWENDYGVISLPQVETKLLECR